MTFDTRPAMVKVSYGFCAFQTMSETSGSLSIFLVFVAVLVVQTTIDPSSSPIQMAESCGGPDLG